MAIKADYKFRGVTLKGVYVRIDNVHGDKYNGWTGQASVYADEASANEAAKIASNPDENGAPPTHILLMADHLIIDSITVSTPYSSRKTNALGLLYDALMARPEFENAKMV